MMEGIGTCKYCGQTAMITTVGEVSQAELDCMATDRCMCSEASSERRKKERKEKMEKYVSKTFEEPIESAVKYNFELVDNNPGEVDDVTIRTKGRTIKIYSDTNLNAYIKTRWTEDEEFKV